MEREDAIALVQRLQDAVNRHDPEKLLEFYSEEAVTVSPVHGELHGRSAIVNSWQTIFSLFPDWTVEVTDVLLDGDRIAFFGTANATDRNGWFGQPPTGGRIDYRVVIVLTIANGKIIRDHRIYDLNAVLQSLEKAQLDAELRLAAEVQRALWSRSGRANGFCEAAGNSIPCRSMGGDFFELIPLRSGDCGITLGDISGKGPAAAVLAAMIQGMLAVEVESQRNPSAILARMNCRLAHRGIEPRFATLVYGVLSPDGRFSYSNAGHNPPIVLTTEGARRLGTGGPILGALEESTFEEETIYLRQGDTMVMFSDGVTDALNTQGEEFGEDRLLSYVMRHGSEPATELLNGILKTVGEFCQGAPQTDDISVTVTRYTGRSVESLPPAHKP
jgi:sigma-B regulation protein RsbU (phosphoserine phosphatase)